MQDLNPLFFVKLGAVPQPILATIALMAEFKASEQKEINPETNGVDMENSMRETTKPPGRRHPPKE
jgi:hypothetical protein